MSKTLIEKPIGGDGGVVGAYLEDGSLIVKASYPVAKVLEPAEKALDGLLDKLAAAIPGSWDDAIIEKLKVEYKADLLKLIGG